MRSNFFSFIAYSFGVILKKPLSNLRSWRFTPMGFIVLALNFVPLVHLVNICIWCKVRSQLHSFAYGYPVFLVPFVEETILLEWFWHPCWKSTDHRLEGIFLGFQFYASGLSYASTTCFDYSSLILRVEIGKCESSNFVIFF